MLMCRRAPPPRCFGVCLHAGAVAPFEDGDEEGDSMAEVPVERRFIGSVRLVTLHLWRIAKSTDLELGFKAAHDLRMFNDENEAFVRRCLALDQQLESGEELSEPITDELVHELQMCVLRLNSADPA